jgi:hypothetical protein
MVARAKGTSECRWRSCKFVAAIAFTNVFRRELNAFFGPKNNDPIGGGLALAAAPASSALATFL